MGTRTSITDGNTSAVQVIQVERVSAARDGTEANSSDPSISADGRFVAYNSAHFFFDADIGLTGTSDVFVFDRQNNTTERVPVASDIWSFDASISADGRFVSYNYNPGGGFGPGRIAVFDRLTNT